MPNSKSTLMKPIMNRFYRVLQLSTVSLALLTPNVMAKQALTLPEAISLTLQQHTELKAYAHSLRASQGLVEQAKVGSAYEVNVDIEDALGTGSYTGVSAMQTTLGISWLLEGDMIKSRVSLANEQTELIANQKEAKMLDLAAETANIYIRLLAQHEQIKLAKIAQLQAEKTLAVITTRVDIGKSSVIDQLRAEADLSKKALAVEDLIHEIEASKAQLSAQWQGSSDFEVVGTLARIPTIAALETINQRLLANPNLKIFASEQRIAQSEIALAKVTAKPAWRISAGVKRNEFVDDYALTASISVPFGSDNRNQGKVIALQAKQDLKQAQSQALQQRLSTQLLLLTHKLKHNRHVVEGLSEKTIPALSLANDKAKAAYQVGSYRYSDWYAVQQELLTSQAELIQAYTNMQLFNIELERLTGISIAK